MKARKQFTLVAVVLIWLLVCEKTLAKTNLGKKVYFILQCSGHSSSLKGDKAGAWTQQLKNSVAGSAAFSIQPTCPGLALPTVGWKPLSQPENQKMLHRLAQRPFGARQLLGCSTLSQVTLVCVGLTKLKLTSTAVNTAPFEH